MPMACTTSALRSAVSLAPLGGEPGLAGACQRARASPARWRAPARTAAPRSPAPARRARDAGARSPPRTPASRAHRRSGTMPWLLMKPRSWARSRIAWRADRAPGQGLADARLEHRRGDSARSSQVPMRTSARRADHLERAEHEQREGRDRGQRHQGLDPAARPARGRTPGTCRAARPAPADSGTG